MATAPDATLPAIVGAAASIITLALSKYLDSRAVDRRDALATRRLRDREQRDEMDQLKDDKHALELENATMRAILIAKDIPLPDFLTKHIP